MNRGATRIHERPDRALSSLVLIVDLPSIGTEPSSHELLAIIALIAINAALRSTHQCPQAGQCHLGVGNPVVNRRNLVLQAQQAIHTMHCAAD